jgi:LysR family transcriptional activator of dmlA
MEDRRLFLALASAGSYQATALETRLSRTTVMRRVEALEKELGLELVHRAGRSISLTEAGLQLARGLRALYLRQDELEADLRVARGEAAGTLRLCGPELGTGYGIVDVVAAFVEAYPRIRVDLELGRDLRKLRPGDFDVAIQLGRRMNPDLKARKLFSERMILVASPRYLDAFGEPRTVAELERHRAVEERDAQGRAVPWRARDGSRVPMPGTARVSANGIGVVLGLASRASPGRSPATRSARGPCATSCARCGARTR